MLHLDHGGIFDYGLNRRAVHTLVARESHFDEAGGAVTAIVVIMVRSVVSLNQFIPGSHRSC